MGKILREMPNIYVEDLILEWRRWGRINTQVIQLLSRKKSGGNETKLSTWYDYCITVCIILGILSSKKQSYKGLEQNQNSIWRGEGPNKATLVAASMFKPTRRNERPISCIHRLWKSGSIRRILNSITNVQGEFVMFITKTTIPVIIRMFWKRCRSSKFRKRLPTI